jgi:hypothetical protein
MKPVPPLADITDVLPEKVENTTPIASPFIEFSDKTH